MRRYFAYGSNMGSAQMRARCPGSRRVGRAWLAEHRWIIARQGYASVVPSPGDRVEGVLWEINPADEVALDGFEEVALDLYRKHELTVETATGPVEALVYIDPLPTPGQPHFEYIARINAGIADADLNPAYVAAQIRPFIPESVEP